MLKTQKQRNAIYKHISRLQVVEHPARYKDMERPMPGSTFVCDDKVSVLQGSQGRNNGTSNYYVDTDGVRHLFSRCVVLRANTGIQFCGWTTQNLR